MTHPADPPAIPTPLLLLATLYGGLVCIAGVLGSKLVAVGSLGVEGGVFAFLLLVATSSVVAERFGRRTANRLVVCGFVPLVLTMLLIRLVLALPPAAFWGEDARQAFSLVLTQSFRLLFAGLIAYTISQFANVLVFTRLRGGVRLVWLRALVAGVLSQALDTLIFITAAFAGTVPLGPLIAGQLLVKVTLSAVVLPPLTALGVAAVRRAQEKPTTA